MNYQDFTRQAVRLATAFGKIGLNEERAKLIWREVKDFDVHWFEKLCDEFIGNWKSAPTLNEISEKCGIQRQLEYKARRQAEEYREIQLPVNRPIRCQACFDEGYVFAEKEIKTGLYAFRCECSTGKQVQENIPSWNYFSPPIGFKLSRSA